MKTKKISAKTNRIKGVRHRKHRKHFAKDATVNVTRENDAVQKGRIRFAMI